MSGFIKLYRNQETFEFLKNDKLFRLWCYIQLKATYKSTIAIVGYQQIKLEPGQFIFGRKKAAEETGLSEKSVRTCLNALKVAGKVAIKTASKYSIITITNWSIYQNAEIESGHEIDHQTGNEGASKGPARGHIQEVKEIKESKEDKELSSIISFSQEEQERMLEYAINSGMSQQKIKMIKAYGIEFLKTIGERKTYDEIINYSRLNSTCNYIMNGKEWFDKFYN